jgi:hypothetical protein
MLRWSAQTTDVPVDLQAVVDPRIDPLLPAGRELVAFVDSVLAEPEPSAARALIDAQGEPALVAAASVIANFQMMNIVADATGMPVGKGSRLRNADLIEELGLGRFDHLEAEAT